MPAHKITSVRLTEEEYQEILKTAHEQGRSFGNYLKFLHNKYIKETGGKKLETK